jgi:hypothetical protein
VPPARTTVLLPPANVPKCLVHATPCTWNQFHHPAEISGRDPWS